MKKLLIILCMLPALVFGQEVKDNKFDKIQKSLKKTFKFATFYGAVNGGNSVSDVDIFSVTNGLETNTISTPFDYSLTAGVRKIARLGYENRANRAFLGLVVPFHLLCIAARVKKMQTFTCMDMHMDIGRNTRIGLYRLED